MNINTKYNIGDIVYGISNAKINKTSITAIKIKIISDKISIFYYLKNNFYSYNSDFPIPEDLLYTNKEELLEKLILNSDE